ncbi:NTP transferase domain-containing protein [Desulforamulus ruminis]|uniref:Uncharacterized protein n=1 Tax=Desulforamulus ruminis (strain ATCC 23193 / DSM 2154 / NCIMB 8452 / DL) TaxID=696281 RepID=F6DMQ6_DESRL|nr:NTP transferase domain-containing protein [Desulforamulus ruminis]AEG58464.1 hypothetical protein Desru_0165 [Desulforamulus ruminis DSM 2154]
MIDALVLAGSKNNGLLQSCSDVQYEAQIKIGSSSMVNYVTQALLQAGKVGRVLVVGPPDLAAVLPPGLELIPSGQTVMENVRLGSARMDRPFLLVTSDIPLLTPGAVDEFIGLCGDRQADLYFPLVPREAVEEKFPEVRRTYVRFTEGIFTSGNLFLVNPEAVQKCMGVGQELVNLRKHPLALARRVGIGPLFKFLFRALSLLEAQHRASTLLGIDGRAVICRCPEIGVDVDKPSDLLLARRILDGELPQSAPGDVCKST